MKHTELAVAGSPAEHSLRLELHADAEANGLRLRLLHDENTGTLARVVSGRIGRGDLFFPVAVKLQRDTALTWEERRTVCAKFDKEWNVHRRLQQRIPADSRVPIVRQFEVWSGAASNEADVIEPCILCKNAKHALALRCPCCDDPHVRLEEKPLTHHPVLWCPRCEREFGDTTDNRRAILDATVTRDSGCDGCPLRADADPSKCRGNASFLTFFRNRVLLFEKLDLDLEDYLRWTAEFSRFGRDHAADSGEAAETSLDRLFLALALGREEALAMFRRHRQMLDEERSKLPDEVRPIDELLQLTGVFDDIVRGVAHLHGEGVAHLDVKPANICLRYRGATLEVKLIDLGLSDDRETLTYLRQAQGVLSLVTDYSAPEFHQPRSKPRTLRAKFEGDFAEVDWPEPDLPGEETPTPGDLLFFPSETAERAKHPFRVLESEPNGDGVRVLAQVESESARAAAADMDVAFDADYHEVVVVWEQHCGLAADIYSLGMVLVSLLVGRVGLKTFRDQILPAVRIELAPLADTLSTFPSRAIVERLRTPNPHLQPFQEIDRQLRRFGDAFPLAEELLGIALRATARLDARLCYLQGRAGDPIEALRRLRADLDAVRAALENAKTVGLARHVRAGRCRTLNELCEYFLADQPLPTLDLESEDRPTNALLDLGAASSEALHREQDWLEASPRVRPMLLLERAKFGACSSVSTDLEDPLYLYAQPHPDGQSSKFCERYLEVEEQVSSDDEAPSGLDSLVDWLRRHRPLFERLSRARELPKKVLELHDVLCETFLDPWQAQLDRPRFLILRRTTVNVAVRREDRESLQVQPLEDALDRLVSDERESRSDFERRTARFETTCERWRTLFSQFSWLDGLGHVEVTARRQWEMDRVRVSRWQQEWAEQVESIEGLLRHLRAVLLEYEVAFASDSTLRVVTRKLSREEFGAVAPERFHHFPDWLRESWPAPSEEMEAFFALWELACCELVE